MRETSREMVIYTRTFYTSVAIIARELEQHGEWDALSSISNLASTAIETTAQIIAERNPQKNITDKDEALSVLRRLGLMGGKRTKSAKMVPALRSDNFSETVRKGNTNERDAEAVQIEIQQALERRLLGKDEARMETIREELHALKHTMGDNIVPEPPHRVGERELGVRINDVKGKYERWSAEHSEWIEMTIDEIHNWHLGA